MPTCRCRAAEEKNALEAAKLLLDLGADVNAANEAGQTSLHAAAAIGANGVVRFLVERGARLDAKTQTGPHARWTRRCAACPMSTARPVRRTRTPPRCCAS